MLPNALAEIDYDLEPVLVEVGQLLAQYHHAQQAAEQKRAERDSVALVNVPLNHPRHFDRQDSRTRRSWLRLDAEMWERRQRATEAWTAYARAIDNSCNA